MTAHIAHDANKARLTEMHRLADANRRVKRAVRQLEEMVEPANRQISIHAVTDADRPAVERLAALDSSAVPTGDVLVAEVAGEPVAAIEVATGTTVADPFRRTADSVELLRARARHLLEAEATTRRRFPRLRSAYRAA